MASWIRSLRKRSRGAVGPGELREENQLDAHRLDLGDRLFQFLERAQARVGIV